MEEKLKLMAILAHPDDESLGAGGALAKYSAGGVETYLVCATRGERGWDGDDKGFPGLEAFGKVREAELHAAARVLGLHQVGFLDYVDGDLDPGRPAAGDRQDRRLPAPRQATGGGHLPTRRLLRSPRPHRHLAVHLSRPGLLRRLQLQRRG